MKKVLFIATLLIGSLASFSQTVSKPQYFVQAGVSTGGNRVVNTDLEFGAEAKNNRVSVVGQAFTDSKSRERFLIGLKYLRVLPIFDKLDGTVSLAAKTRVDNTSLYVVEPGAGFNYSLGKGVGLVAGMSVPVSQTPANKRQTSVAGNAGLIFKL